MSWQPLLSDMRRSLGVRLGYKVKPACAKSGSRLRMSICAEYVKAMRWNDGDIVRVEVDLEGGCGRIATVARSGIGTRRICVRRSTRRGHLEMPWTGSIPTTFPNTGTMTELVFVEAKPEDGLVFELPKLQQ